MQKFSGLLRQGDHVEIKLEFKDLDTDSFIWTALITRIGREQFIYEAEKQLCLNIQENVNDPSYDPTIEIRDDLERSVNPNMKELFLSQEGNPWARKLDFCGTQLVSQEPLTVIKGVDVEEILEDNIENAVDNVMDSLKVFFVIQIFLTLYEGCIWCVNHSYCNSWKIVIILTIFINNKTVALIGNSKCLERTM